MRAFSAREHDGKRLVIVGTVSALEFHCVHDTAPNGIRHMRLVSIGCFRGGGTGVPARRIPLLLGQCAAYSAAASSEQEGRRFAYRTAALLLPSPLWGGVGGGGRGMGHGRASLPDPPPRPSPTRGEGAGRSRRFARE